MCTILQCITSHKHRSMILERRDPSSGFDDTASEIKRRAPRAGTHPFPPRRHPPPRSPSKLAPRARATKDTAEQNRRTHHFDWHAHESHGHRHRARPHVLCPHASHVVAFAHAHPPGAHAHPSPHELHAIASLGVRKKKRVVARSFAREWSRARV